MRGLRLSHRGADGAACPEPGGQGGGVLRHQLPGGLPTFMYPYTAWKDSFIHNAFENAAATISGVETAYRAMKKPGQSWMIRTSSSPSAATSGTYDIGFQSLSGAMERGHDMVYVCYDNEAYMNTGIQRSSSTPTLPTPPPRLRAR